MRTERVMRHAVVAFIAASGLMSGGCATQAGTGALAGGGIGAGAGALVGAATGHPAAGAAIGGALGAGTGAAIGASADAADRDRREIRQATAVAQAQAQSRMGLDEVVTMARHGQSEQVIINQIRSTGSTFQLTSGDLDYLKTNGVPDRVILEMQSAKPTTPVIMSRPSSVYVEPVYVAPPRPVVVVAPRPYYPPPRRYYW